MILYHQWHANDIIEVYNNVLVNANDTTEVFDYVVNAMFYVMPADQ